MRCKYFNGPIYIWIEIDISTLAEISNIVNSRTDPVYEDNCYAWEYGVDIGTNGKVMKIRITNNGLSSITLNNYNLFYNLEN